jgi:Uma2 family endonuclease
MQTIVLKDRVTNRMTDEEFLSFCQENQDLRIERNNNLEIIIMSPVSTLSGLHSSEIFGQLSAWSKKDGRGIVFDASAGFTLPDRSVLSPDASWLSLTIWNKLSEENKDKFAPVCPEFVIEVRSKTDDLDVLRKKMKVWIKNGVELAWLIDPREKISFAYKGDEEIKFEGFNRKISGEGPVKGFELDLSQIQLH